jgi:hypothetical protein
MRSTIQAVGRLPPEPPPAELREELLRRFASMRPPPSGCDPRD